MLVGGMRVLVVLRMLMQNLSCIVAPAQVAVGNVADKLDESGAISDEKTKKQLANLAKQVVDLATKLKSE